MENKIIETAKGIFSAKNLKRAGIVAVIGAVLAGGGAYWHYGQEAAAKARVSEARTQMVHAGREGGARTPLGRRGAHARRGCHRRR